MVAVARRADELTSGMAVAWMSIGLHSIWRGGQAGVGAGLVQARRGAASTRRSIACQAASASVSGRSTSAMVRISPGSTGRRTWSRLARQIGTWPGRSAMLTQVPRRSKLPQPRSIISPG